MYSICESAKKKCILNNQVSKKDKIYFDKKKGDKMYFEKKIECILNN